MDKQKYAAYLQTEHWSKVRYAALQYAENRCQLCYSLNDLQVHHRTYERLGNERPADLIVLCKSCHEKHHDRHDKRRPVVSSKNDPALAALRARNLGIGRDD